MNHYLRSGPSSLLALLMGGCLAATVWAEPPRPNVVLVMADDQGWGQVGYRGHPHLKTPNLVAMAEAGLRLDRFYAGGPVCSPTRATVLTGRTHFRTGVPSHGDNLCLQEKTLPEALKQAGYASGQFGKWHLNGVRGPGIPILADDPNHPGRYGFDEWLSVTNFFDVNPLMSRRGTFEEHRGDSSEIVVNQALAYMGEQHAADTPFLAVIWFGSPHSPMIALGQDRRELPDDNLGNHLGEVRGIDRSIGILRSGLRELGIERDTLVWYCSDNGGLTVDPDSRGGLRGHKGQLYEGGIRVPGIVEWPGQIEPAVSSTPAVTMDIFPTLVDLLGLPADSLLAVHDGQSVLPLLRGEPFERERAIPFRHTRGAALIDGDYKVLNTNLSEQNGWELYDVSADPNETNDLSGEAPARFQQMKSKALAQVRSIQASSEGKDYPEGRVVQSARRAAWWEMEEYEPYLEEFLRRPEHAGYRVRAAKARAARQ